ncbi:hypothetical protein [Candidatus Vidania fulgoroideorum]
MKKILTFNKKYIFYFISLIQNIQKNSKEKVIKFFLKKNKFKILSKNDNNIVETVFLKNHCNYKKKQSFSIEYESFINLIKNINYRYLSFYKKKNIICFKKKNIYFYINLIKYEIRKFKSNNNLLKIFIENKKFYNILNKSLPIIKNSEYEECVFIFNNKNLKIISSDNFRLIYSKIKFCKDFKKIFVIKKCSVLLILKLLKLLKENLLKILVKKNFLKIRTDLFILKSNIYFKKVFDYSIITNLEYKKIFNFNCNEFLKSILRAKSISKNFYINLNFEKNKLLISSNNFEKENFLERINIENNYIFKVCLNIQYFYDFFNNFNVFFNFYYNFEKNILMLKNKDFKYFLMPIENI